ncbi:hypothetical protein BJX99DRAFT_151570 [Aspergillus californicus]
MENDGGDASTSGRASSSAQLDSFELRQRPAHLVNTMASMSPERRAAALDHLSQALYLLRPEPARAAGPSGGNPPVDDPPVNGPPVDDPSDDEPCDDGPSDDEPCDDEPCDDEPCDDEPSDDEPSDDEPSDDGPSDDDPSSNHGFWQSIFDCLTKVWGTIKSASMGACHWVISQLAKIYEMLCDDVHRDMESMGDLISTLQQLFSRGGYTTI